MIPELRPRGVGEMLDVAVSLYRARFGRLVRLALLVVVPVQVLSTLVLLSAQPDRLAVGVTGNLQPHYDASNAAVQLGATLTILVISLLSTAFVVAVSTRVVADAYVGRATPTGEPVGIVLRRFPAVVGVGILVALSEVAGLFACGIGLFVPLTLFSVAVPALVLEGVGVLRAMARSWELVRSSFWRAFGLVLSAHLLAAVVNLSLAGVVNGVVVAHSGITTAVITQGAAAVVASVLTTPFTASAVIALYFDVRTRVEGFDIQMLLGRAPAAPAPGAYAR